MPIRAVAEKDFKLFLLHPLLETRIKCSGD